MSKIFLAAASTGLALAVSACGSSDTSNGTTPAQPAEAQEKAGDQTIAAALDKNGKFYQAAHAVGPVLKRVSEQTGLTVREETRRVRVLTVERKR